MLNFYKINTQKQFNQLLFKFNVFHKRKLYSKNKVQSFNLLNGLCYSHSSLKYSSKVFLTSEKGYRYLNASVVLIV